MRSTIGSLLLGSIFGAQVISAAAADSSRPTVTLASGVVVGTKTTWRSATAPVEKYIGIPFAAEPERFSPPKPHPSWTKPLDATITKPACVQQFIYPKFAQKRIKSVFNDPGQPTQPKESEDCLYLNVYVPPGTKASDGKPVLFWIYGGNLQFGTGGLAFYDGAAFATDQDVIVVTHNYRTNIFGFPNSPEIQDTEQNLGFLDQRAALAWTHANIAKFGGSPSRITLFGESAGGESVKQLVAQPPSPLPFQGAIMESQGNVFFGNGRISWEQTVMHFGCSGASSALACMRSKPAKAIKDYIEKNSLSFSTVDDGKTYITDVRDAIDAGTAAKVPLIIGNNQDEGRVFAWILGLDKPGGGSAAKALNILFPGPGNKLLRQALIGILNTSQQSPYLAFSRALTDLTFLCTTSTLSAYAQDHGYSGQVWRYLYNATFPNLSVFPDPGAYHSSEIPQVFGTYPLKKANAQQRGLSKYMQTAWAQFAKDPANGPGWQALGDAGRVANLGGGGISGKKMVSASSLDGRCPLFNPLIDAQGY